MDINENGIPEKMDEEEKRYFSEATDNELPEGIEYDVFSENTAESRLKAETMNRDYLTGLYKEDMEFLNKDIRMTRTGYIREYNIIQENCVKDVKQSKKRIIFHTVIFLIAIVLAVYLFSQFYKSWELFKGITIFIQTDAGVTKDDGELRRAYWAMTGLYGSLAWITFCLGLFQFVFFTISNIKAIKLAKRLRIKATRSLEGRKKDCMLLGQYDASR